MYSCYPANLQRVADMWHTCRQTAGCLIRSYTVWISITETKWCATQENRPYVICWPRRPWSACTFAQADLGLRYLLTESVDNAVYVTNRECSDQNAHMSLLILNYVVIKLHKGPFCALRIKLKPNQTKMVQQGINVLTYFTNGLLRAQRCFLAYAMCALPGLLLSVTYLLR